MEDIIRRVMEDFDIRKNEEIEEKFHFLTLKERFVNELDDFKNEKKITRNYKKSMKETCRFETEMKEIKKC